MGSIFACSHTYKEVHSYISFYKSTPVADSGNIYSEIFFSGRRQAATNRQLIMLYCFIVGTVTSYLHRLSGEVFVQCVTFKRWNEPKPAMLILTILSFLVMAFVYVVASLLVRIGFAFAFDLFKPEVRIEWPGGADIHDEVKNILVLVSIVGFVFLDMVYTVAIINHAAQCELNIYFLQAVKLKTTQYNR